MFWFLKAICLWVCIIFIGLEKPNFLCKPNWNRRAYLKRPIKLLFKIMRWIKKILTLESFIRFSFWNSSLLLQKKKLLLHFLYVFGFCNQANSLTPALKILLVFLCEAVANQLQQSKGCCGVNHVLRSVQIGDLCNKGKKATTRSSLIGYWSKGSTVS